MIAIDSYPVFKPNQVLSFTHLNKVVEFLQREEQATRAQLIGVGVVCGLEVENDGGSAIRVSAGVGITSAGFLVRHPADSAFTHIVGFDDASGTFGAAVQLWELREQAPGPGETGEALSDVVAGFLEARVVVAFLDLEEEELGTCLADTCTDQGAQINLNWRFLLVPKTNLLAVQGPALGLGAGMSEVSFRSRTQGHFDLVPPALGRVLLTPEGVEVYPDLAAAYAERIERNRDTLDLGLRQTVEVLAPRVGRSSYQLPDVRALIDGLLAAVRAKHGLGVQQLDNHLRYLGDAVAELQEVGFALQAMCQPPASWFANYLMLDAAVPAAACRPPLYRSHFVPSPQIDGQHLVRRRAELLFGRVTAMLAGFARPATTEVRITPGTESEPSLDRRVVPYYYDYQTMAPIWSWQLASRCRADGPLAYDAGAHSSIPRVATPLQYSLAGCDFLRIEGHLGLEKDAVVANIEELRTGYDLPFDLVTVGLGALKDPQAEATCSLEDLRALYLASREELLCTLGAGVTYLTGLVEPKTPIVTKVVVNGEDLLRYDYRLYKPFSSVASSLGKASASPAPAAKAVFEKVVGPIARAGVEYRNTTSGGVADHLFIQTSGFQYLFPLIPGNLYPHILKVDLADLLIQELIGRLTALSELLPEDVLAFDLAGFKEQHDAMRAKAQDLIDDVEALLGDTSYEEKGFEPTLISHLTTLLRSCILSRLEKVVELMDQRSGGVGGERTLADFIHRHPGVEHRSGVPCGGTFILVCARMSELAPASGQAPRAAAASFGANLGFNPTKGSSFTNYSAAARGRLSVVGGHGKNVALAGDLHSEVLSVIESEKLLLARKQPAGLVTRIQEWLNKFGGTEPELPQDPVVVVADFCLPYQCCSDCAEVRYVVAAEVTLTLPKSVFCKGDTALHPFTASPAGGTLNGEGIVKREGGWDFRPADVAAAGTIMFTYSVGGREAGLAVEVRPEPVARFSYVIKSVEGGHAVVEFVNTSEGGDEYDWDLGDGTERDGVGKDTFEHQYDISNAQAFDVTLEAYAESRTCMASIKLRVTIETVVFDLPVYEFCGNDDVPKGFITNKSNGEVSGEGVVGGQFVPAEVELANQPQKKVELHYRWGPYEKHLEVMVVAAPSLVDFAVSGSTLVGQQLTFTLTQPQAADKVKWDFGDGTTGDGASVDHAFKKAGTFGVKVTVTTGPCEVEHTEPVTISAQSIRVDIEGGLKTYCFQDEKPYRLIVTPSTASLEPAPWIEASSFVPAKAPPGTGVVSRQVRIVAAGGGLTGELVLTVVQPVVKLTVPKSVAPGGAVQITAEGSDPNSLVIVTAASAQGGRVTIGQGMGRFSGTFPIPNQTTGGTITIEAATTHPPCTDPVIERASVEIKRSQPGGNLSVLNDTIVGSRTEITAAPFAGATRLEASDPILRSAEELTGLLDAAAAEGKLDSIVGGDQDEKVAALVEETFASLEVAIEAEPGMKVAAARQRWRYARIQARNLAAILIARDADITEEETLFKVADRVVRSARRVKDSPRGASLKPDRALTRLLTAADLEHKPVARQLMKDLLEAMK